MEEKLAEFDIKPPCSSAKGGLKMVTGSLTGEDSGFAANTENLAAGARVVACYYGRLAEELGRKI